MTPSNAPVLRLNSNAFKPLISLGLNSSHTHPPIPPMCLYHIHTVYPHRLKSRLHHFDHRQAAPTPRLRTLL